MKEIVILGGGISGLASAWFLKKRLGKSANITIVEKDARLGGWIQTSQENGYLFEHGPRSCRTRGAGEATLELIEDLQLQDKVILGNPAAHRRYLYFNKKLHALPRSPFSLPTTPWIWKFLPILLGEWRKPCGTASDESVEAFVTRRFGRDVADFFIDPLVSGIYAGDMRQLSIKACFPSLKQKEQQHGSIIKSLFTKRQKNLSRSAFVQKVQKSSLFTLQGGMETLIQELHKQLEATFLLSTEAVGLHFTDQGVDVRLNKGKLHADHLILALPAPALIPLLPSLRENLRLIPHASIASVHMGFRKQVLKQAGFGYLVPSKEKEKILGMVWDSSAFPHLNKHAEETRLTVMIGGAHFKNFTQQSEKDFLQITKEALQNHLGIREKPDSIICSLSHHAIPQYIVGHENTVHALEKGISSLSSHVTLLGSSFHGVSVNDCVAKANKIKF